MVAGANPVTAVPLTVTLLLVFEPKSIRLRVLPAPDPSLMFRVPCTLSRLPVLAPFEETVTVAAPAPMLMLLVVPLLVPSTIAVSPPALLSSWNVLAFGPLTVNFSARLGLLEPISRTRLKLPPDAVL